MTEQNIISQIDQIHDLSLAEHQKKNPDKEKIKQYDEQSKNLKIQLHELRNPKPQPVPTKEPTQEEMEYKSLVSKINDETITATEIKRFLKLDRKYRGI